MKQQVFSTVENGIMTIKVDNPETKNGLDWEGINQLCDCYDRLLADDSIRVAILTGNDEFFYTGGRVEPTNPGENEKYADALTRFLKVSGKVTTPMIAAVNGNCMKAGMGAMCMCDFVIAREGVVFNFPEVRMGGVPMMVLVDTVDRLPKCRALEALLLSWDITAQDAYMLGLVNRVVPAEEFWPTVNAFAQAIVHTERTLIDDTRKAYFDMVALQDRDARVAYADRVLRSKVLTDMAHRDTEYNV